MNIIKRCWAEISLDNLLGNLNIIKQISSSEVLCVVKSNAYGHGDEVVVKTLQDVGVNHFAVASISEAVHLRKNGCIKEILLLGGYLEDCFQTALDYNITLAVYDYEFAKRLSGYALKQGKKARIHIKLNTGMTRIGFDCIDFEQVETVAKTIKAMLSLEGLDVCGVFTHFSVSDECDGVNYTKEQLNRFLAVKNLLERESINIKYWHCANSGAIVNYPESHFNLVRAGILLYGMYNGVGVLGDFKPVLSLKSVITQIRNIEPGATISYGKSFVAKTKMRVAVVSIGYGDGYPRVMSNGGKMIVNGKYATIVGRVCMDQTIIDVSDVECNVGDTVTVIGSNGPCRVLADDIANADNTINYEIVCRLTSRIPRVYYKNGEIAEIKEYI